MFETSIWIGALALVAALTVALWALARVARMLAASTERAAAALERLERRSDVPATPPVTLAPEDDHTAARYAELERELSELRAEHEALVAERDELSRTALAHEAKLERIDGVETDLRAELCQVREAAEQNRRLYLLLRSLLIHDDVLELVRTAVDEPGNGRDVREPGQAAPESAVPDDKSLADDAPQNDEQRNAVRVARVLIEDLFLYNPNLFDDRPSESVLRYA